ncbi:MAG TPA: glycosyltransferase family 2 protein [Candidatus Scatavimonas merdigallinarum]|uniref:Glycosyltransferase family 2 protein n=1 Tax=Candidatus Scatavimonas merdigallinarum TaxID=2840914 RepID=A0A9D1CVZ2_9FIRM|nr:glycosyltransferase family 2 protein [Candidatus Scatavimonas merdigallinarum]
MTTLYLAVPCYNEEEVLYDTTEKLLLKMESLIHSEKISQNSRILYIDDGSKDKTWQIICDLHARFRLVAGCKLSRNRGHQNALYGGLMAAKEHADAVISIDADLQDDIDAIDRMLEQYEAGYDIVYGVRSKRRTDTFFKRVTAEGFYKFLRFMGAEIVFNHADYRLMSKRALDAFAEYKEVNLFLRGLVPMIGFKTATVTYERRERLAGKSKYPLKKMLSLAWEGVTSLSIKPIRFVTILGAIVFAISIILLFYSLFSHFWGNTVPGWTSLAVSIWAIGGLQLLAIGIIGEYLGKIYMETKQRPRYFIETFLNDEPETEDRSQ